MGWHVVTIWECALGTADARKWLSERLPALLGKPDKPPPCALPMVAEDPVPYG